MKTSYMNHTLNEAVLVAYVLTNAVVTSEIKLK